MADIIKTQYMDKAIRGYSEYVAKTKEALDKIVPKEGDRAILLDGSLYVCLSNGKWDLLSAGQGGTGGSDSITVDQSYNPESQNAQSGLAVAEAVDRIKGKIPELYTFYGYTSDNPYLTFEITAEASSKDLRYDFKIYSTEYIRNDTEILSQESVWTESLPLEAFIDTSNNNITQVRATADFEPFLAIFNFDIAEILPISLQEVVDMLNNAGGTTSFGYYPSFIGFDNNNNGKTYLNIYIESRFPDTETRDTVHSEISSLLLEYFKGIIIQKTQFNYDIAEVINNENV